MTQNTPAPADLVDAMAIAFHAAHMDMVPVGTWLWSEADKDVYRSNARKMIAAYQAHMASDVAPSDDDLILRRDAFAVVQTACEENGEGLGIRDWLHRGIADIPAHRRAAAGGMGDGWRSMDSAPKDGTAIMLWAPPHEFQGQPIAERVTIGHWTTDEECREQIGDCGGECRCPEYKFHDPYWLSWDGGFTEENPPFGWMPPPSAPNATPQPDPRDAEVEKLEEIIRHESALTNERDTWLAEARAENTHLREALELLSGEAELADPLGYGWKAAREKARTAFANSEGK